MLRSLRLKRILAFTSFGLLLTFQNCAQAPEEDGTMDSSSYDDSLPFAYNAEIDTIAYMSCSGMNNTPVDKRAYFTFRAGAYADSAGYARGGLSLSSQFLFETRFYGNQERAELLGTSRKNANTLLTLSIRQKGNLQAPWKEGELRVGEELEGFLPSLDSGPIAGPLASTPTGVPRNYFPGDFTKRLMEASLRLYNFENTAVLTRNTLMARDAVLVAGYSDGADESNTSLRGPEGISANTAYGSGFHMYFGLPRGYTTAERRVISASGGIEEIDLTNGAVKPGVWDCNENHQFTIVRPEDFAAGRVNFAPTVDTYSGVVQETALMAIRRVLRVEDWYVDVARRAVMPKRTGDYCYGPLNGRTVKYSLPTCMNSTTALCPHFVTVCLKR